MSKQPMIGKGWVWAWVAMCVGFAGGHLLARADRIQQRVVFEKMRADFEALKAETMAGAEAQRQLAAVKSELVSTQQALAAALAAKPPAGAPAGEAGTAAEPDPKQAFSDMVLRIGQTQLRGQVEGRLGVLKERLQLTPEQEAAVKKILDDESAAAAAALDRLMAGEGTPADFGRLARLRRGELPAGVEVALTDAQKPEFAAFQEQEKVSGVENRVNMELSGLVTAGGLTPEQKDQAFSSLSGILMAEDVTDFDTMKDGSEVRAYMDEATTRRLEAMQPILTEPQLQMYQQQVEMSRQVLSKLLPADSQ
jgi:hypothetical protein